MDAKEQIKQRVSITDVASMYVDLKPAGKYMKALCPFHTEKTPSFYIKPENDTFTCYGCNKFGDIFTMVQELENLSFPEAMNFLIEKFHVPVDRSGFKKVAPTKDYSQLNEMALTFFRNNLIDSPEGRIARQYLKDRGISEDTIQQFSLGYAENKWDSLHNFFRSRSCDIEKAVELGLLIKNVEKQRVYDRFRGRIIFPIYSESGTLVAFGGRTIFDDQNKYLNSPDTPLYKKSKHLYGFNNSKNAIREKKSVILVEGYFDMVSLSQHGVQNTVASLGTALTAEQVYLLKRFSETIYIYYDSDKAGIAAAVRGIEKMFEQNINPRIIAADGVKDPDDFIRAKGLKAFNQLLESADDGFRFLLKNIDKKYDTTIPEQKNRAVASIMNFVDKFGEPIVKEEYTRMAADYFKVDEKIIKTRKTRSIESREEPVKKLDITPAERIFLQSVLAMPHLIDSVKDIFTDQILSVLASRNIIRSLLHDYNPKTRELGPLNTITNQLTPAEQAEFRAVFDSSLSLSKDGDVLAQKVESSLFNFIEILNRQQFRRIDQKIKIAERENNKKEVNRLMTEKQKYIQSKYKHTKNTGGPVENL